MKAFFIIALLLFNVIIGCQKKTEIQKPAVILKKKVVMATEKPDRTIANVDDDIKKAIIKTITQYIQTKIIINHDSYPISYKGKKLLSQFKKLYDTINEKGNYYLISADFQVGKNIYNIDFFVQRKGYDFIIDKEVLHKINHKKINITIFE